MGSGLAITNPRKLSNTHCALNVREVTPAASGDLPDGPCRALHVNDEGVVDVELIAAGDSASVVWTLTGPGMILVSTRAVRITGTTATDILALY